MLKKIESLRNKPKEVRNRFAFWFAFLFTSVIVVFWLASMPARLADMTGAPQQEKVQGGVSRTFSDMKASLFGSFQDSVQPEAVKDEEVSSEQEKSKSINFDTFFSTSSNERMDVAPKGVPVLIGTTSISTDTEYTL